MTTTKVALVGGGGAVGTAFLKQFPEHSAKISLRVLSSRAVSPSSDGIDWRKIDYESSAEELAKDLEGAEVVILALSSQKGDIFASTKKVLDASVLAGVKNVVLSEYSGDLDDPHVEEILVWNNKKAVREYARSLEGKLSWASVSCGSFLEWSLAMGFAGFNVTDKKATLIDHGEKKYAATGMATLIEAVYAVVDKLGEGLVANRTFFVRDVDISQVEILSLFQAKTSAKWSVDFVDSAANLVEGLQLFKLGELGKGYGKIITSVVIGKQPRWHGVGVFGKKAVDDMEFLGLKPNAGVVEEAVSALVK